VVGGKAEPARAGVEPAFADLKEQHRREKRGLIEAAAARTFADKGHAAATMADVARAAGVSTAAIYLYFDSRDELLFATAVSEIDELEGRMGSALESASDPVDELRRMVAAYYDFYRERPQGFSMLMAGLERGARVRAPAEAVAAYDRAALRCLSLLNGVVKRGMKAGSFRRGDTWQLTHAIWGTFHGVLQLADNQPDRERFLNYEVGALLEAATETLLDGMRTREENDTQKGAKA
jgi:AcrR family transcriptional regulator